MNCSGRLKDFKPVVIHCEFIFTMSIFNSNIMKPVNWLISMLLLLYIVVHVGFRFICVTVRQYFFSLQST